MAITVTWATKIINIPKADTTLIQSNPTEIRELDINVLRLRLKDLEDDSEGMPFLDTHRHNTEVLLAGITYARVVEIINDYTVTFEDGQYAVNLFGANHNVGDVANVNQVSVRVNNSAGLISSPAIEFSSFQNAVWIDITKTTAGTTFDLGTPANPVGNITDALLIATVRGLTKLFIIGDITFDTGHDLTNFELEGESPNKTTITINPGAVVDGVEIRNATITGTLDNISIIENSTLLSLSSFDGVVRDGTLTSNTITMGAEAHFIDCHIGELGATPVIDMNGSVGDLLVVSYSGNIRVKNLTGNRQAVFEMLSGRVEIDSTCTAGTVIIAGSADYDDNSGPGCTVDVSKLNQNLVWNEPAINHLASGSMGELQNNISQLINNTAALQSLMDKQYALQGANTAWNNIVETDNKITQYRVNRYADNTLTGDILTRWLYTATYSGDTLTTLTRIVMFDLNPIFGDNFILTDNLIVT